jgi:hypothetical protein
MASADASAVTASFPFATLTPFATERQQLTHASLLLLLRELNANAMSVHSKSDGGLHGHHTLTVTLAQYLVMAGATNAFPAPVAPPPTADALIPANATSVIISRIEREHKGQVCVFQ